MTRRLAAIAAVLVTAALATTGCSTSEVVAPAHTAVDQSAAPAGPSTEPLLTAQGTTVLGQPLAYPTGSPAEVSSSVITLLPGQRTGPHRHDVPLYAYILSGTLTVAYDGGTVRTFPAGSALMEAVGVRHEGSNEGSETVRILAVYLGADGVPNTVKL